MDKYDEAIAYLTENPDEIKDAWGDPSNSVPGSVLFGYVGPEWTDCSMSKDGIHRCGCLQQIRQDEDGEEFTSWWPEITRQIRQDRSIPKDHEEIGVGDLEAFAKWQRIVDDLRESEFGG